MNLQPPGSEPGVLPIELSLKVNSECRFPIWICIRQSAIANRHFPLGERLDSNQQPEAYEAPALPLSYAPVETLNRERAAGRHRTGDRSLTRRLLCQLSYHGASEICDCRLPICDLKAGIAGTLRFFNRKSAIANRKSPHAAGGLRTHDIRFGRPALCPSELPLREVQTRKPAPQQMRRPGIEPGASALAERRSRH